MKLLFTIMIGWLIVAEMSAKPTDISAKERILKVGFDKINDYLGKSMPNNRNVRDNLDRIKYYVDNSKGSVRAAGQMLLEVTDFGDECNTRVLSIMLDLHKMKLSPFGYTRVESLMKPGLMRAREACSGQLRQTYKASSASLTKFFSLISPLVGQDEVMLFSDRRDYGPLEERDVYYKLRELTKGSPEMQFESNKYNEQLRTSVWKTDRAKFDVAFQDLLVKQCRLIVSNKHLLETMPALIVAEMSRTKPDTTKKVSLDFDDLLEHMNWTRKTCNKILDMESSKIYYRT